MALLILATVFVGFARTYFLAGVFRAPLPSLLVHIHGAVFFELDSSADRADRAGLGGPR
jgi:hypothetical protein